MAAFAAAVRARDLDAGRALFDPRCRSFGTRVADAADLGQLVREQWAHIWPTTSGFEFDPGSMSAIDDAWPADPTHPARPGSGGVIVVLATWRSLGAHHDGLVTRAGRCTIVLRRAADAPHGCIAVHTHFSETPSGSAPTPA